MKRMQKGDKQDFKTRTEFEKKEGKIITHTTLGHSVMFWTKDGTYIMSKKKWDFFMTRPARRK